LIYVFNFGISGFRFTIFNNYYYMTEVNAERENCDKFIYPNEYNTLIISMR